MGPILIRLALALGLCALVSMKDDWRHVFAFDTKRASYEDARVSDLRSAVDLGPATVGGTECEQYALRQEGVDWQVWMRKGDTPLPRKLVIAATSDPAQPQYVSVLKWNLTPKLDDATFSFPPPESATRIVLQTANGRVAQQAQ